MRLCFENLIKRAKSEIDVAMDAPNDSLGGNKEREELRKEVFAMLDTIIKLPQRYVMKYDTAGLSKRFVENLVSVLEFILLFYGRNDLPCQSINKIGFISTDLKNDNYSHIRGSMRS